MPLPSNSLSEPKICAFQRAELAAEIRHADLDRDHIELPRLAHELVFERAGENEELVVFRSKSGIATLKNSSRVLPTNSAYMPKYTLPTEFVS